MRSGLSRTAHRQAPCLQSQGARLLGHQEVRQVDSEREHRVERQQGQESCASGIQPGPFQAWHPRPLLDTPPPVLSLANWGTAANAARSQTTAAGRSMATLMALM